MKPTGDKYLKFGPYLDLYTGLRTALDINDGIIKLVGSQGSGKSAICRQVAEDLRDAGFDVIFFETPPKTSDVLYQRIRHDLGLSPEKNFNRMLSQYLLDKKGPANRLIILYDDAEEIPKDIFILIRLLNNVHDHAQTLVSQIICGTARLDRLFDDPQLRSLTQYLNQSFTLEPMNREALDDFYAGYRREYGIVGNEIKAKGLNDIFKAARGMPGKTLEMLHSFYGQDAGSAMATDKAEASWVTPESSERSSTVQPVSPSMKEAAEWSGVISNVARKASAPEPDADSPADTAHITSIEVPSPELNTNPANSVAPSDTYTETETITELDTGTDTEKPGNTDKHTGTNTDTELDYLSDLAFNPAPDEADYLSSADAIDNLPDMELPDFQQPGHEEALLMDIDLPEPGAGKPVLTDDAFQGLEFSYTEEAPESELLAEPEPESEPEPEPESEPEPEPEQRRPIDGESDSPPETPETLTREVNEILLNENAGIRRGPVYFKAGLTIGVGLVTVIIAVALLDNGSPPASQDQLSEILANDSPLYMDEIEEPPLVITRQRLMVSWKHLR